MSLWAPTSSQVGLSGTLVGLGSSVPTSHLCGRRVPGGSSGDLGSDSKIEIFRFEVNTYPETARRRGSHRQNVVEGGVYISLRRRGVPRGRKPKIVVRIGVTTGVGSVGASRPRVSSGRGR